MNWRFWERSARPLAQSPENPSTNLANPAQWLLDYLGGTPTDAGVNVNEISAMRTSAVYACVSLIAKTIASLPLKVFRMGEGDTSEEQPEHQLYYLLHDEPNPAMTSCVWREYLTASLLLSGNAYVAIGRNRANQVIDLFPIPPRTVKVERVSGRNQYHIRVNQVEEETWDQADILHIPGMGFDGVRGMSVVTFGARQAVGLSLATESHGSRIFSNGARLGVVLKHPKTLSKDAQARLRTQFDSQHVGLSQAFKTLVLEEGLDVTNISMTSEDAQFLDTRRFQVEDIARFFGVPPHLIGHTEKQTTWGTGLEQQTLGFLIFTIIPWLTRFEQEFNRKLFPRSPFFAQFKHQAFMRGDSKARAEYYASGHQNGWLTQNEIRKLEDLPPVDSGDQLYINGNLVPSDEPRPRNPQPTTPAAPAPARPPIPGQLVDGNGHHPKGALEHAHAAQN